MPIRYKGLDRQHVDPNDPTLGLMPMGIGELELFKLIQEGGEHMGALTRFLSPEFEGTAVGQLVKEHGLREELEGSQGYFKALMQNFAGKSEAEIADPAFKMKFPQWDPEMEPKGPKLGNWYEPGLEGHEGALFEEKNIVKDQILTHRDLFDELDRAARVTTQDPWGKILKGGK